MLSASQYSFFGCGRLGYSWIVVAFALLVLTSSTPTYAQSFSDDFNRPDGTIGNGWGVGMGQLCPMVNLRPLVPTEQAGGVYRSFPVTLPVKFSFDFRSESPHPSCDINNTLPGGGWLIAFNAPGAGYAGAQIEFFQYYGSQPVVRQYQTSAGVFADSLPSASPDFGPAFVHISGTVNADLSATLTIGSVTYNFGPAPNPLATAAGSNLVLSNSSCGGGPFFFDNLSVVSGGGCQASVKSVLMSDSHTVELDLAGQFSDNPLSSKSLFVSTAIGGVPLSGVLPLPSGATGTQSQSFFFDLAASSVPRFTDNAKFSVTAGMNENGSACTNTPQDAIVLLPLAIILGIGNGDGGDVEFTNEFPKLKADLEDALGTLHVLGESYRLKSDPTAYPTLYALAYPTAKASFTDGAIALDFLVFFQIKFLTYADAVNIVTHSKGGLVARAFLSGSIGVPQRVSTN